MVFLENKLKNLPKIYCMSYETCIDRQNYIIDHFKNYNINNYDLKISTEESDSKKIITGHRINELGSIKGHYVTASHLLAIKEWYETTDDNSALFLEDDVSFETANYWNFTWEEFENNLPDDWECIHLGNITYGTQRLTYHLHPRITQEFGLFSLIKRSYAKKLIDWYIKDINLFNFTIPNAEAWPICENIMYMGGKTYNLPLLIENINLQSVFPDKGEEDKCAHINSNTLILNWWKENGDSVNIKEILNPIIVYPELLV
jgi:hypothetical protein